MRTTRIATLVFALATVCTTTASAQQVGIAPGLWQIDMTLPGKVAGSSVAGYLQMMKQQVATLPPEQRSEIEKGMAELSARGTEFTGDGLRTKHCITKQDIANFDLLGKKAPDTCTRKATPVAGGFTMTMTCTQPRMQIDAAMQIQSDKAYTFESTTNVAGPDGRLILQKSNGTGKWLSGDCGNITSGLGQK